MNIKIRSEIELISKDIIEWRRHIHSHPELGLDLPITAKFVSDKLSSWGIDVQTEVGVSGVVGTLNEYKSGPIIALRADMDALPIQETGDVPYKSKNDGVMHACGHDGHTAMLLGAAKIISEKREILNGSVKFIFQPGEEGYFGAKHMINDGCLNGVDEIYGIHLWNYQPFGEVGVKSGPILAAADKFKIIINGIGGHGAAPQGTVDAIVVGAHLVNAFQTIVSRNTNPIESAVVTVGKFHGGNNFNIISDSVELVGTTRAYKEDVREMIIKKMKDIVSGTEKMFGANIELEYQKGYPPTINNTSAYEKLLSSAQKIVGENGKEPYLSMGAEDFSYFANEIPGCFFFVGSAPLDREPLSVPHHCSHFDIDERALLVGSSIFLQLIEDSFMVN
ncbi:MAG: peptidase M20 [Candidatus Marinimicrobia bacterium]|nr:peptidase M20 [Candidatus Neomarinimicrobiota bacterium]|tara:strand:- start:81606 stop:82781 length:1176 start_codon:yes stop_codon:yes gene_type:complete